VNYTREERHLGCGLAGTLAYGGGWGRPYGLGLGQIVEFVSCNYLACISPFKKYKNKIKRQLRLAGTMSYSKIHRSFGNLDNCPEQQTYVHETQR